MGLWLRKIYGYYHRGSNYRNILVHSVNNADCCETKLTLTNVGGPYPGGDNPSWEWAKSPGKVSASAGKTTCHY